MSKKPKRVPPAPPAPPAIHVPPEGPASHAKRTDVVTGLQPASPRWSVFTKFLVSLILVVVTGAVLVRFQEMITPLVVSVILTYLLRPLVERIVANTRLSWGLAAALVYLTLLIVILSLLTIAGIALVQQIQGLYAVILNIAENLPDRLPTLLSEPVRLGPFVFDLSRPFFIGPFGPFGPVDFGAEAWAPLYDQAVAAIQPALSRTGVIIGSLATGTAATLGWLLFILVISFYLLNDVRNIAVSIENLVPDGYEYDVRRLVTALGPIWNAFLRGQITLGIVMGITTWIVMALLGVRYSAVLGLLAGLLEFVPVIGPFIAGAVAVLVALFQPVNEVTGLTNYLGLNPLTHAIVVLVAAIVLQQVENNVLVPRILGGSLGLHPVIILVGAVVAANLAGVIGLLLSAPIMATLRLIGSYIYRKLFDQDPWPDPPPTPRAAPEMKWARWLRRRMGLLTRSKSS
jgi:predicted PurR-regulated permease PerM